MDPTEKLLLALMLCTSMILLGLGAYHHAENEYQAQAIEHGYAQYCPNGAWAWKGECER